MTVPSILTPLHSIRLAFYEEGGGGRVETVRVEEIKFRKIGDSVDGKATKKIVAGSFLIRSLSSLLKWNIFREAD